jgi:protein-tyrosine phosphatase
MRMAADEILPNLFLGDGKDLAEFTGEVVYVREDIPLRSRPDARWVPFHRDGKADTTKLDEAAAAIDELLQKGDPVFVHCGAGTKRSPLAVAWYLHKYKGMTIDEAYAFIQQKRPIVLRMTDWLP